MGTNGDVELDMGLYPTKEPAIEKQQKAVMSPGHRSSKLVHSWINTNKYKGDKTILKTGTEERLCTVDIS
ncbi:hypothetical protein U1Q18_011252 [Sarracenia purpurea var. burkii]